MKVAWVAQLCLLCKEHTVLLQSFSICQAARVILKGPEIAWPSPEQINECGYFNKVWNSVALRGQVMLWRLSLAIGMSAAEK